jgi:NAD kinase
LFIALRKNSSNIKQIILAKNDPLRSFFFLVGGYFLIGECPHSYRRSPQKAELVRMKASFGQGKPQQGKTCLNEGLIRTEYAPKSKTCLNECPIRRGKPKKSERVWVKASFGQGKPKKSKRVRMKASFGQSMPQKVKTCLNECLIRTGEAPKRQIVSE